MPPEAGDGLAKEGWAVGEGEAVHGLPFDPGVHGEQVPAAGE